MRSTILAALAASVATAAAPVLAPFTLRADLEDPRAIDAFAFSDAAAWRVSADGRGRSLELHGASRYQPPHRSPLNIALLTDLAVGDFVLEADLKQTGRDYGHRDMCVFFGFQDPAHFYYAHIATKTDDHAHNVFIVDGAARRKISTFTTDGVDWGRDAWHRVRVERSLETGVIRVFFDRMDEPIMEAQDRTFGFGHVGFGSFDDTGRIDDIRLVGPGLQPTTTRDPFARSANDR
jgi:hypothetical protein